MRAPFAFPVAFYVGANYGNESNPNNGPFQLNGNNRSSNGNANHGARLSIFPEANGESLTPRILPEWKNPLKPRA